jgi:hypothetical protein
MAAVSPYETVALFGRAFPSHVAEDADEGRDRLRLRAYDTYTEIYQNNPEVFGAVLKLDSGNEVMRRLVASGRKIVEASNRYFGRGLAWVVEAGAPTSAASPGGVGGEGAAASTPDGGAAAAEATLGVLGPQGVLTNLFRREEFGAKYMSMKRWSLIRGDGMLHITADPTKEEGTRLSITELNPATYFAIKDPANSERVTGCYIVNIILDDEGEEVAARLHYQKINTPMDADDPDLAGNGGVGTVFAKLTFWEVDGWDDRGPDPELKPVAAPARFGAAAADPASSTALLLAGTSLPTQVTSIPVYHFRNNRSGNSIFGTSELQGIESLIVGVNQTATDQELAVALTGLGLYWTNSGQARDPEGNAIPYKIAPGSMLSIEPDSAVGRLTGVDSITASKGHADFLDDAMQESSGTPAVAVGRPNNTSAESGVALAIEMSPVVSKGEEKEEEHLSRLTHMLYDLLTGWLPAYEGYNDDGTRVTPVFDDPVPVDRSAVVQELNTLVSAKIVSTRTAREVAAEKLGYQFPEDEDARLAGEAQAALDLEGARLDAAVGAGDPAAGAGTGEAVQ